MEANPQMLNPSQPNIEPKKASAPKVMTARSEFRSQLLPLMTHYGATPSATTRDPVILIGDSILTHLIIATPFPERSNTKNQNVTA